MLSSSFRLLIHCQSNTSFSLPLPCLSYSPCLRLPGLACPSPSHSMPCLVHSSFSLPCLPLPRLALSFLPLPCLALPASSSALLWISFPFLFLAFSFSFHCPACPSFPHLPGPAVPLPRSHQRPLTSPVSPEALDTVLLPQGCLESIPAPGASRAASGALRLLKHQARAAQGGGGGDSAHTRVSVTAPHAHPLSILDALSSKAHSRGADGSQRCVWGWKGRREMWCSGMLHFPTHVFPCPPTRHLLGGWRDRRQLWDSAQLEITATLSGSVCSDP